MDEYKITQKSDFRAPQPPAAVCKALYDAADRVKKLAPWKLFCEVDICEIYLKDQEEPFYCSIQGMTFGEKNLFRFSVLQKTVYMSIIQLKYRNMFQISLIDFSIWIKGSLRFLSRLSL